MTIKATLSRTNDATSLQLTGDTGSSFSIASLSSVTFQKFSLLASLTVPNSGSTVINNLALSGGLRAGSLGSGNGTFSYANQATNFSMEIDPALPAPFKNVRQLPKLRKLIVFSQLPSLLVCIEIPSGCNKINPAWKCSTIWHQLSRQLCFITAAT